MRPHLRSVTKDDDDRAYFVIENGMVIYMFVEEVNSKDDAQAAKVEITGEKDVTIGASLTLTANVTLKDPKYDRVTGYQWYYTDSPANYGSSVADIEKHATKIPGATSATYTVDTSAALAGRYFYCVVETYNDKVDGKDTAKSADMSSLDEGHRSCPDRKCGCVTTARMAPRVPARWLALRFFPSPLRAASWSL